LVVAVEVVVTITIQENGQELLDHKLLKVVVVEEVVHLIDHSIQIIVEVGHQEWEQLDKVSRVVMDLGAKVIIMAVVVVELDALEMYINYAESIQEEVVLELI
jgi:hypothetical protein